MPLNLLAGLILAVNGATHVCEPGEVLDYLQVSGSDVTVSDCRVRESRVTITGKGVVLRRLVLERAGAAAIALAVDSRALTAP